MFRVQATYRDIKALRTYCPVIYIFHHIFLLWNMALYHKMEKVNVKNAMLEKYQHYLPHWRVYLRALNLNWHNVYKGASRIVLIELMMSRLDFVFFFFSPKNGDVDWIDSEQDAPTASMKTAWGCRVHHFNTSIMNQLKVQCELCQQCQPHYPPPCHYLFRV